MDNKEVADVFERIANLLQIQDEPPYRVLAYRRASESIRSLTGSLRDIREEGALETIPGVGKAIAEKISELLNTGKLEFYERLISNVPESLLELLDVPDVGPKRVSLFWKELDITTVDELKEAARNKRLQSLTGIGERTEKRILESIKSFKSREVDRISIGIAWPLATSILEHIRQLPDVTDAEVAGSLRRGRETVGDLDFIIATDEAVKVIDSIKNFPAIENVLSHGVKKMSVELEGAVKAQFWLHGTEQFGSALQYATGSQAHNVRLREFALRKGLSLSEYGFKAEDGAEILCPQEAEVYKTLDLPWIPPEIREDRGEIQVAAEGKLPELITENDLRGEVHAHSNWSDGLASIQEMAEAAIELGLSYLVISDHSRSLGIANGLSIDRLRQQREEIDSLQKKIGKQLKLLQGSEVEILADATLDYPDSVLKELDFVVASLHTSLRQSKEKITARFISAITNPHVDLIGHLSGRLIGKREPADLDIETILKAAARHGVALEINAHPDRLDLNEIHAKRAIELGCFLAVTTDAHQVDSFHLRRYGVGIGRRAWVSPESVINTWELDRFLEWVSSRGE